MSLTMQFCVSKEFFVKNNFFVRSNADNGLWAFFLLPASLIISSIRHPVVLTPIYKLAVVASFVLLCNSLLLIAKCFKNERLRVLNEWSLGIALFTGSLFNLCLHKGLIFSLISGLYVTIVFIKSYAFCLQTLRESFTLGEAGILAQGFTLFTYCIGCSLISRFENGIVPRTNMQMSTTIIQMGLIGIIFLSYTLYIFSIKTAKAVYAMTFLILTSSIIIPLHVILGESPVIWIFAQIWGDILLLKLFAYWSFCVAIAVLAVNSQIFLAKKATTGSRKMFHILAVLVFLPGLYYRCSFLYLASGVVLGIFFALEILRVLCVPPLGNLLQDGYFVFSDEKDAGLLALTPVYLLVGVSIPLWIHPSPCDVTDSAQFSILPLISGLLSIGVGDTAASYVGSNYGKLKWKNSSKTVEGTSACILSQFGLIYFLYYSGCLRFLNFEHIMRIVLSVVVGSLVEAKTTQVDNLVLPFVMYLFLI